MATGKDFDQDGTPKKNVVVVSEARARGLATALKDAEFRVISVEEKPYRSSPKAPFMTSTLQQEGGRKLRLSASQVMRLAQGLYERGYITYMRTDNVVLSDDALAAVRSEVPVSYTHLRAHETVLDLVCRLLLEKKKTLDTRSIQQINRNNHK